MTFTDVGVGLQIVINGKDVSNIGENMSEGTVIANNKNKIKGTKKNGFRQE